MQEKTKRQIKAESRAGLPGKMERLCGSVDNPIERTYRWGRYPTNQWYRIDCYCSAVAINLGKQNGSSSCAVLLFKYCKYVFVVLDYLTFCLSQHFPHILVMLKHVNCSLPTTPPPPYLSLSLSLSLFFSLSTSLSLSFSLSLYNYVYHSLSLSLSLSHSLLLFSVCLSPFSLYFISLYNSSCYIIFIPILN